MDFKKFVFLFIVFFLVKPMPAQELDSSRIYKLSDVVVSATKTKNSTLYLASSISVIDSAEISRRGKISLIDLLKTEYGVSYTSQGNQGALSFVNIRGANTGHTLVLIDGVEMNMPTDPGNTFDFSTVTTANINRIEILRGPQSTLYGSDALAGVINIFTNEGSRGLKFNVTSEGGSYNTFRFNGNVSGGSGIVNYNLNYGRVYSDGYSSASSEYGNTEKDGFFNSTISARGGIQLTPGMKLDLRYHFTKAGADLDRFGGTGGDDPTYISNVEEAGFRGSVNLNLFDNLWDQTAGVSFNRNFRKYRFDETLLHSTSSRSAYDGSKIKFDWQNNFTLPYNVITAGAEYEKEKSISEYHEFGMLPYSSIQPESKNDIYGIYLQDQFNYDNAFFFTPGIRYDKNDIFGSKVTYKAAPAYFIASTGTKIKGSYGTGFKSPSLFYLFDPVYGNKDLEPEESNGWDLGVEQYFFNSTLMGGLTYFRMNFENMFGFHPVTYKTVNIHKASSEGFEFYLTAEPVENLRIKSNYTFTQVKDKSDGGGSSVLFRRPKHKAAVTADFSFLENIFMGMEVIYTGERSDNYYPDFFSPPQRVALTPYTLINYTVSYRFLEMFQVYTRLENILNEKYEEVYGFGVPGFSIYGGVKIDTGNLIN